MNKSRLRVIGLALMGVIVSAAAALLGFALLDQPPAGFLCKNLIAFAGFFTLGVVAHITLAKFTVCWGDVLAFWLVMSAWLLVSHQHMLKPIPLSFRILESATAIAGLALSRLILTSKQ